MVHSSQRPHKCGMCSKTFLSTSKLKQHLNIHSGDRPFKCRHCPKDFTNFPNWLKHTRRRHKVDHKTGEKLVVMPNFLNKPNKTNKTGKKSKSENCVSEGAAAGAAAAAAAAMADIKTDNANIKLDDDIDSSKEAGDNRLMTDLLADKDMLFTQTIALDKCTMPFVVTKSGTEHSTITVNNRTLPLNTSDDLERAASLLMHQTLDLEDEFEFVNIKSESFDPITGDSNNDSQVSNKSLSTYNLTSDFTNFHYTSPDFMYASYYPQATQCDFAMMPLPPINTVKRKLKGINSSSSIFPGMTNVL